jgi:hypothetical protein
MKEIIGRGLGPLGLTRLYMRSVLLVPNTVLGRLLELAAVGRPMEGYDACPVRELSRAARQALGAVERMPDAMLCQRPQPSDLHCG